MYAFDVLRIESRMDFILKVTMEYLSYVRQALGVKQEENVNLMNGALVRDLLCVLAEKHGEPFRKHVYDPRGDKMKPNNLLIVNGMLVSQLNGAETKLKDGDRLALMPAVHGG